MLLLVPSIRSFVQRLQITIFDAAAASPSSTTPGGEDLKQSLGNRNFYHDLPICDRKNFGYDCLRTQRLKRMNIKRRLIPWQD
jgi:hypothetical protein